MSFEAEVIPLFIGGTIVVSALELIAGLILLRGRKRTCTLFACHSACMLIGFYFLVSSLFANHLNLQQGIDSISNSVNVGLFGVFWAFSAGFVIAAINDLSRSGRSGGKKTAP